MLAAEMRPIFLDSKLWLKRYGYLPDVDVDKLDQDSAVFTEAVRGMQGLYGDDIVGPPDGILGKKTWSGMLLPRCGHPDNIFGGSGSWPNPCQKTGVTISVNKSGMPNKMAPYIDSAIKRVVKAWQDVGLNLILVVGQANIMVSWRWLAGSTIGLAYYNNETCSDQVDCYLDSGFSTTEDQIAQLLLHETAHNCNCNHQRRGVMTPYLQSATFNGWHTFANDPTLPIVLDFFDGPPVPPTPPPTPTPTPMPIPTPTPTPPPQPPKSFWERLRDWWRNR